MIQVIHISPPAKETELLDASFSQAWAADFAGGC